MIGTARFSVLMRLLLCAVGIHTGVLLAVIREYLL